MNDGDKWTHGWEPQRKRAARQQGNRRMVLAAFVLILIVLAYSVAFKPLPGNLGVLAISQGAMRHLGK